MLPGWCCIAIAALELGNIDSWYHMCAFRFHFWGRKVNWNQASHVRASSVAYGRERASEGGSVLLYNRLLHWSLASPCLFKVLIPGSAQYRIIQWMSSRMSSRRILVLTFLPYLLRFVRTTSGLHGSWGWKISGKRMRQWMSVHWKYGGLLSPSRPYDIFLQIHAQIKVYGPSLAMTDNWDARVTQIGLTKSVHEYAVYQLLSTAEGWTAWKEFLPVTYAHPQMLLTRAIRLINVTRIRPAHARQPHPTWVTAIKQIFRCYHPQAKCLYLKSTFPHLATLPDSGSREIHIYGFSAGSFTGLALHEILTEYSAFPGVTKVAAIAAPPELMNLATGDREVTLIHCIEDRLCVWRPYSLMELSYQVVLIEGHPDWTGRARHSMDTYFSWTSIVVCMMCECSKLPTQKSFHMGSDVKAFSGSSPGLALTCQCTWRAWLVPYCKHLEEVTRSCIR